MSSTISVARRAAAFVLGSVLYYALFETTYESNVSPKRPHECCVAFGTAQQVNAWILKATASCVSGSLRRPGGDFTPEGYLRSWRTALAQPFTLLDRRVILPPDPDSAAILRLHGLEAVAKLLDQGLDAELQLHADAVALAGIIGERADGHGPAPWRIIQPGGLGAADKSLAMKPAAPITFEPALPRIFSTGLTNRYDPEPLLAMVGADGRTVLMQQWQVMSRLLSCEAFDRELVQEGSGMALAKALLAPGGVPSVPLPDKAVLTYQLKGTHMDYVADFLEAVAPFATVSKSRLQVAISMGAARQASEEARSQLAVLDTRATIHLPAMSLAQDGDGSRPQQGQLLDVAA